jgi:hypothetical protein
MCVVNPDDGLKDAAFECEESKRDSSAPPVEAYEKPQIRPQDEEQEGDFWCD